MKSATYLEQSTLSSFNILSWYVGIMLCKLILIKPFDFRLSCRTRQALVVVAPRDVDILIPKPLSRLHGKGGEGS